MKIPQGAAPLHLAWRDLQRARKSSEQFRQQQELENEYRKSQIEESFADVPEEAAKLMRLGLELQKPLFQPTGSPVVLTPYGPIGSEMDTLEEMRDRTVERSAYERPGLHVEQYEDGSMRVYDFEEILNGATEITLGSWSKDFRVCVNYPGDSTELGGAAAIAFKRFLHYIGIFAVEARKRLCPDCGDKEPQDCLTCSGLGWIIGEVEKP